MPEVGGWLILAAGPGGLDHQRDGGPRGQHHHDSRHRPDARGSQASAALARILQDTDTLSPGALAGVATWADDLRARARHGTVAEGWGQADIEDADQFNGDNPSNPLWYFVDLPLGAAGYPTVDPPAGDPLRPFITSADIVHTLRRWASWSGTSSRRCCPICPSTSKTLPASATPSAGGRAR